jgi:hypothetical protein
MLAYWAGAAVLGVASAALYLAALALPGGVLLASFTQAPLFLAGLTLGLPAALAASATSALVVWGGAGLIGGVVHAIVNALPVLVLIQRALLSRQTADGGVEWYPPGLLVSWLTGLAVLALGVLLLLLAGAEGGIEGAVQRQIEAMLPMFGPNQDAMRPLFEIIAPVVPGMVVAAWMTVTIVNGALAQAMALKTGRAARPAPDIAATELPRIVAAGLAIMAGLALVGPGALGVVGANATVVLTVPFLVLGFAVVHAATKGLRARGLLLGGLYAVTAILTWPVIVIVALGLIEQGFGLKRRFAAPRPGGVT